MIQAVQSLLSDAMLDPSYSYVDASNASDFDGPIYEVTSPQRPVSNSVMPQLIRHWTDPQEEETPKESAPPR